MADGDLIEVKRPADAAIVTARLVVTQYLTAEGQTAIAIGTSGDCPLSTYLGMTALAQHELVKDTGAA